jgi:hypothetical protein
LGQRRDYTAVAVLDEWKMNTGFDYMNWTPVTEPRIGVRHLERLPLGTSYVDIVERVKELEEKLWDSPPDAVVVDATGVGAPVVDLLRKGRLKSRVVPVTITAGDKARSEGGHWMVPKQDLVAGLQVLLEQQRLRVAGAIPEAATFVRELQEMRVKVGPGGREQYGAWREGAHDDLVLAVALAYWWFGTTPTH